MIDERSTTGPLVLDDSLTIDEVADVALRHRPVELAERRGPDRRGPRADRADLVEATARLRPDDGCRSDEARARRRRRAARLQQPDAARAPHRHGRGVPEAAVRADDAGQLAASRAAGRAPASSSAEHLVAALNAGFAPRGAHDRLAGPVRPGAARRPRRARSPARASTPPSCSASGCSPGVRAKEALAFINSNAFTLGWTALALQRRRRCSIASTRPRPSRSRACSATSRRSTRPSGTRGRFPGSRADDRAHAGAARRRHAAGGDAASPPAGPADDARDPADARGGAHRARTCARDRGDRARLVARQPRGGARRPRALERQLRLGALRRHARLRPPRAGARPDRVLRARQQARLLGVQRAADRPAGGRRRERGRPRDHRLRRQRRGRRGPPAGASDDARVLDVEHGRGHRGSRSSRRRSPLGASRR